MSGSKFAVLSDKVAVRVSSIASVQVHKHAATIHFLKDTAPYVEMEVDVAEGLRLIQELRGPWATVSELKPMLGGMDPIRPGMAAVISEQPIGG